MTLLDRPWAKGRLPTEVHFDWLLKTE